MEITVHPLSHRPNDAWAEISKTQYATKVNMYPPSPDIPEDKIRIICMSDTHSLHPKLDFGVPDGDIFIHAGDFTNVGKQSEVVEFNNWMGSLPHKHKIVIAGNHELTFDNSSGSLESTTRPDMRPLLTNCTYIEDELIEVLGLRIYGSPWQPEFGGWAFNLPRGQPCLDKWNKIPSDIDILITHGPPLGRGDLCRSGIRAGCVELLTSIQQRIKPKYHIFGHIHEDYGTFYDGKIVYINASTCNFSYKPINPPVAFDVDLPPGVKKNDCSP